MYAKLKKLEGKVEYGRFLKEYLNVIGPAYFYDYSNSDHDLMGTTSLPNLKENGSSKVASNKDFWGKVAKGEIVANLEEITCPVIHFEGEYDINPAEDIIAILQPKIKNYRLVKLEKTGHIPWLERKRRTEFIHTLSANLN